MRRNVVLGYLWSAGRLATLLVLHVASAGLASPAVIVARNGASPQTFAVEWLPIDNQTVYKLEEGEVRRLELNTSSITETTVYLTVSPCSGDVHWAVYHSMKGTDDGVLKLVKEYKNNDYSIFSTNISKLDRYILQLSSANRTSAVVVSTRGESPTAVRLRLRTRSKRRLAANWDPSPIDPQATSYCVVASYRRNYTSLCAAQRDLKFARMVSKSNSPEAAPVPLDARRDCAERNTDRLGPNENGLVEVDNKIDEDSIEDNLSFSSYQEKFRRYYRRKKFSRSTKVTDEDPTVACIGDRTNHLIENLDPSKMYFVSIFGIGRDRRAGALLATGSVKPRGATARRLRENVPFKTDLRGGKLVLYYKTTSTSGGGVWLSVFTCGSAVDLEISARGKRLHTVKGIDQHSKFFVPAPIGTSSLQDTSDDSSAQFDSSSSEETKIRFVIKITPSRKEIRDVIGIELIASPKRWSMDIPELAPHDGAIVRELRPRRSCHSVEVAFLPATHFAADVIRYCVSTHEIKSSSSLTTSVCAMSNLHALKTHCVNHKQIPTAKVVIHRINGLRAGRKYAIQISASTRGIAVPYNTLLADTNVACTRE